MNDSLGALLAIVVLWSILRFAFGGGSNSNSNGGHQVPALNTARTRQVPQHMVDSVKTLFPHISDASIRYDLQRSGSVEATCERILNEGGLPSPPAGFFGTAEPSTPNAATLRAQNTNRTPNGSASASASSVSNPSKSPNLISRFGLQSRIASSDDLPPTPNSHTSNNSQGSPSSWATTPEERAKLLKDRKEQMILEARRKLLERQQNAANGSNPVANGASAST